MTKRRQKVTRRQVLAGAGAGAATASGGALKLGSSVAHAADVSFGTDILPLINRQCVICHMPGGEQGDLGLYSDAFGALVGVPSGQSPLLLIEPGSAERSYLYRKLVRTQDAAGGSGVRMPFQRDPLDAAQIESFRLWTEQGAKRK